MAKVSNPYNLNSIDKDYKSYSEIEKSYLIEFIAYPKIVQVGTSSEIVCHTENNNYWKNSLNQDIYTNSFTIYYDGRASYSGDFASFYLTIKCDNIKPENVIKGIFPSNIKVKFNNIIINLPELDPDYIIDYGDGSGKNYGYSGWPSKPEEMFDIEQLLVEKINENDYVTITIISQTF